MKNGNIPNKVQLYVEKRARMKWNEERGQHIYNRGMRVLNDTMKILSSKEPKNPKNIRDMTSIVDNPY